MRCYSTSESACSLSLITEKTTVRAWKPKSNPAGGLSPSLSQAPRTRVASSGCVRLFLLIVHQMLLRPAHFNFPAVANPSHLLPSSPPILTSTSSRRRIPSSLTAYSVMFSSDGYYSVSEGESILYNSLLNLTDSYLYHHMDIGILSYGHS